MSASAAGEGLVVHRRNRRRVRQGLITLGAVLAAMVVTAIPAAGVPAVGQPVAGGPRPHVGPVAEISRGCPGQNAEAEQAVDGRYVYVAWIGCNGSGSPAPPTAAGPSPGRLSSLARSVTVSTEAASGSGCQGTAGIRRWRWRLTTPCMSPTCCTAIHMSIRWLPSPTITGPRSPG